MASVIPPHVTVVHDLDAETEARLSLVAAGIQPFRLHLGRAIRLDDRPLKGVALAVNDYEDGLARLCNALGTRKPSLPHVTLLNPRNVRDDEQAERSWRALRDVSFGDEFRVDAVAIVEEGGDVWREVGRLALGR